MRLAALACALLLVLAGCGGVIDTPTPTATEPDETATPTTDITVIGGELPVDAEAVFRRILNMTGQAVDSPVVYVESPNESSPNILDRSQSPFRTALGFDPPERSNDSGVQLGAYTPAEGNSVHIYEAGLENETYTETTLAHEFVHTVQFQTGWALEMWNDQRAIDGELTYDGYQTYYLLLEGSAQYVEYRYGRQFLPDRTASQPPWRGGAYENASAYVRWNLARYTLGAEYVAEAIDSPAGIESLYDEPPQSTEQILHHTDDRVESLSVSHVRSGGWRVTDESAMGELFLRIALRTELNRSAAVEAAHGWGNDRRIDYERGNATGTAWVLRWDDAANATEFESAFERYLHAKATKDDDLWYGTDVNATYRLQRPSEQHVVVFLGNESFVRGANATAPSNISVDVVVEDESAG